MPVFRNDIQVTHASEQHYPESSAINATVTGDPSQQTAPAVGNTEDDSEREDDGPINTSKSLEAHVTLARVAGERCVNLVLLFSHSTT
jgi:hypothetical protein